VHFRYRGSIAILDTRDGIVIVVPISGITQHYLDLVALPTPSRRPSPDQRLPVITYLPADDPTVIVSAAEAD